MSTEKKIPSSLPILHRAATVESVDAEKRTVTFALTSEQPVERWWGSEILDHSPKSVRQDRLKRGIPLLFGHSTDQHIGRIESYGIKDGKLNVTARFGNSALAEEKFRDVQDGILVDASGGYIIHEYELVKSDDKGNSTYRITDWEPVEGSLVPIPADPTVGIGRELAAGTPVYPARCLGGKRDDNKCECDCPECEDGNCADCSDEDCDDENCRCAASRALPTITNKPAQAAIEERSMAAENVPSAGTPAVEVGNNTGILAERARVNEINALASRYPKQITREQAEKFVNEGAGADAVRRHVLDVQVADAKANEVRNLNIAGLSDSEKENYSILRALNTAAEGGNCFELEVSQDLSRKLGRTARRDGFFVPMDVKMRLSDNERQQNARGMYGMSQRAGLDANTAGNGLNTIFTEYVSLIELLRNKMMVRALGATVLSGLSETIAFPKQASAGTATWVADNPGADVADSNLTFAQITMTPKLLQSSTSFSRKLLLQSSVDVEALVRNDLMQIVARAIDLAAIAGTGAANQPKGILNQVGIGSVATGGTALTYASFVLQETQVAAANADIGTMAYLTTAGMRGKLKQVAKLANTLALPVWNDGEVNGYRAEVSNQMPIVGSAPALHSCLFGVWNQLLIGEWGALEVIVDPYRLKKQGMIEVTTFDTCDVNVRHPESFSAITDANPLL
jgi:HK97 family phage major capsid protein